MALSVQGVRNLTVEGLASPGRQSHSNTTLCISLVILHTSTTYTGRRQNDFNVYA
jgi:hypothetical protein